MSDRNGAYVLWLQIKFLPTSYIKPSILKLRYGLLEYDYYARILRLQGVFGLIYRFLMFNKSVSAYFAGKQYQIIILSCTYHKMNINI